ncbi:YopX family protein [uncultured Clostridium sp.]|uniref:YopX family protein n=1 Tax=uncultured Clostridium sp. TaxID=59620 RepID=UPI000822A26A|nr:YopX family protein [uncultured Clostridium sp.]UVM81828.1 MAG: YopX protein [Bacteriophage sp.]SCJ90710.1 YopX protein [uncultured Clostridium sp.]DAH55780.1 MAG TPA: YopX protein [Caudoviricetes sp.]
MAEIKFKIYDKNRKRLISGTGYSITGDGEVQTFNSHGVPEGTVNNRHLKPVLYSGKKDITGRDIYEGFIVERKAAVPGDEEITGVVVFDEYSWLIRNDKEERAVFLFSETAEDKIIGNVYEKEYFV